MISSELLLVCPLFILLLHSVLLVSNGSAWVAENKDNSISVPNPQNGTLNLEFYLCDSEGQGKLRPGTILSLDPSVTHRISLAGGFCVLQNMSNLTVMSGNDTLYANISCSVTSPDVFSIQTARGFAFLGGSHVKIQQINLMQCGGPLSSSFFHNDSSLPAYFGLYQSVALFFTHTFNLSLINVTISEYYGFAIAAINPLGDTLFEDIEIHNALSHNLPVCTQDTHIRGNYSCYGSGLLIYNHDGCLIKYDKRETCHPSQNNIVIKRSYFYENTNFLFDYVCILNVFQFQASRAHIVSGPALTVYATQHQFNSSVLLTDSSIYGNIGQIAGGILTVFIDTPFASSVVFNNVNLSNNTNTNYCIGKGLITYIHFTDGFLKREVSLQELLETWLPLNISNSIVSEHKENNMHTSSTVYVTMRSQPFYNVQVLLKNVQFINNSATYTGICFNANTAYEPMFGGKRLSVRLINVNASNNIQSNGAASVFTNSSMFVFYRLDYVYIEGVHPYVSDFRNNLGSVIDAFSTNVYLHGRINFTNNTASMGPAILLRGSSFLVLSNDTFVLFKKNVAFINGGAIYSVAEGTEINDCFLQLVTSKSDTRLLTDNFNVHLTFIDNLAFVAGNSIYARPLQHCFQTKGHIFPRNLTDLYQKIFHFPGSTIDRQMTSIPVTICKCNESSHEPNCTERFETYEMYPGQSLSVYIVALDENNVQVQSQVNAFFSYNRSLIVPLPGWNLVSKQEITRFIGRSCQKFNYTIESDLKVTEGHLNLAVPGKPSYIYVPIKLKKCPPGLILKNDRCQCGAFVSNQSFGLTCNSNEMTVTKGANAWVGIVTQGNKSVIGYSKYCPNEYCSTTSNVLHINDSNSTVCLNNREGVLCGNCKSGYSALHRGPECKVCSNNGLFWLIGNVSAGLILVFLLFFFKLTINVGAVGGLIFYANVFAIANAIPINQPYNIPLVQLVQLLNMRQAFAACLYSGMHYYVNLYMNFFYSLYLWLIVGFIIFLAHYSTKVANLLMGSSVQVLMTLIHLSLAKLLVSSIDTFLFARVHTESADPYTVWLYNGSIHYGTGVHIPLLITASLFTSIVIVPYVGLALFGWTCLRFSYINKFRPFFDTIYGPYKDSYRYWFGLRLVLLVFIAISTASMTGEFTFYQYLLQIVLLVIFTIFQAYLKPFKKSWDNILDTWCMLNVLALVCINMYRIYQDLYSEYIFFASLISICSTILGILLYHVLKTFRYWFVFCKNKRAGVQMLNNSTPEVEEHQINSNQQFREPLLQVSSNDFREPLLDYMDND